MPTIKNLGRVKFIHESNSPPPTPNWIWLDKNTGDLKKWDSSVQDWKSIGGGTSGGFYSPSVPSQTQITEKLRGYQVGETASSLNGKSFSFLFDKLLFPTKPPELVTSPSAGLTVPLSIVEAGSYHQFRLTGSLNKGAIRNGVPSMGNVSVVGNPEAYNFKIPDGSIIPSFTNSFEITQEFQAEGEYIYGLDVQHLEGVAPYYDSLGRPSNIFDSIRQAGVVSSKDKKIISVLPYFHGNSPVKTVTSSYILDFGTKVIDKSVNPITIDFGTLNNYHWFALPSSNFSSSSKNAWADSKISLNNGAIGTSDSLFEAPYFIEVPINGILRNYGIYVTRYPTDFLNPLNFS